MARMTTGPNEKRRALTPEERGEGVHEGGVVQLESGVVVISVYFEVRPARVSVVILVRNESLFSTR